MTTKSLLPPEEEYEGQFEQQEYEHNKALLLDRIFNYLTFMQEQGNEIRISRLSSNHLIMHPLGKNGKTLDIRLNGESWPDIYRKKIYTKAGRKWLEKNFVLPMPSKTIDDCSLGKHLI